MKLVPGQTKQTNLNLSIIESQWVEKETWVPVPTQQGCSQLLSPGGPTILSSKVRPFSANLQGE